MPTIVHKRGGDGSVSDTAEVRETPKGLKTPPKVTAREAAERAPIKVRGSAKFWDELNGNKQGQAKEALVKARAEAAELNDIAMEMAKVVVEFEDVELADMAAEFLRSGRDRKKFMLAVSNYQEAKEKAAEKGK